MWPYQQATSTPLGYAQSASGMPGTYYNTSGTVKPDDLAQAAEQWARMQTPGQQQQAIPQYVPLYGIPQQATPTWTPQSYSAAPQLYQPPPEIPQYSQPPPPVQSQEVRPPAPGARQTTGILPTPAGPPGGVGSYPPPGMRDPYRPEPPAPAGGFQRTYPPASPQGYQRPFRGDSTASPPSGMKRSFTPPSGGRPSFRPEPPVYSGPPPGQLPPRYPNGILGPPQGRVLPLNPYDPYAEKNWQPSTSTKPGLLDYPDRVRTAVADTAPVDAGTSQPAVLDKTEPASSDTVGASTT